MCVHGTVIIKEEDIRLRGSEGGMGGVGGAGENGGDAVNKYACMKVSKKIN